MNFKERITIEIDNNPNGYLLESVNGTLLSGESALTSWIEEECRGYTTFSIRPAYHNGAKCFLLGWVWSPKERGNISKGQGEKIISLDDGIKLMREKSVWNFFNK